MPTPTLSPQPRLQSPGGLRPLSQAGAPQGVRPRPDPQPQPESGGGAHPLVFSVPHRAMFLSGGLTLLVGFALWAWQIAARAGVVSAATWSMPPGWLHALIVLAGVFPFFIFGFLLTAMPRWQGGGDLPPERWLWSWRLLAAGWGAVIAGLWLPSVLVPGIALVLAGWAGVARLLWRVAHGPHPDRMHARTVSWAVVAGGLALAAWLAAVLAGDAAWTRVAVNVGVWWFLVPVFFTVCHRMVPFFSSSIVPGYTMVRPRWALGLVCGASVAHGALAMAGLSGLTWLVDGPAALAALWLSWRWRPLPALKVPLLGMLHIGFVWLGLALLLFTVQGIGAHFGYAWLGTAPLHALGVGFFGSLLLAMVSRVTLGHSGRALAADALTWRLFLALQAVAVLRIAAELVPWSWYGATMLAAVLGWLAIFVAWALRYLPIYIRPRADGRPG